LWDPGNDQHRWCRKPNHEELSGERSGEKEEQKRWLSNPTINLTADLSPILVNKKERQQQCYFPQEEEIARWA
jgi:hypothetical protein